MSHDEHARRLDDIEKRVRALEKLEEKRWRNAYAALEGEGSPKASKHVNGGKQWCECGRDVCRAPNCFSHKPDPLGR